MIPIFENQVEFLESLLPLLTGIEFLEHRIQISDEILRRKERIKSENKKEFIDEFQRCWNNSKILTSVYQKNFYSTFTRVRNLSPSS